MPVLSDINPSLGDLAEAVLQNLGVLDAGQPIAAEDADLIQKRLFPVLEGLNNRDVIYIDPDNIGNDVFLPLAKIMAWEVAMAFNIKDQTQLMMLKTAGETGGTAEQELKNVARLRTPRRTARLEVWNYPYGSRTGGW